MTNLLFLCSRNRLRSPTAERVFADWPGVETASAGLAPDADEPLTPEEAAELAKARAETETVPWNQIKAELGL